MADHAVEDNYFDGDIFVYRGGRAPLHITHAIIDKSVDEIEVDAFRDCVRLLSVETHDGVKRVGTRAFSYCKLLRRINLKSVTEIGSDAFYLCRSLVDVEFDELETIGKYAFGICTLEHLKLPSIVTIEAAAFNDCTRLEDIELSERLETIESYAFGGCKRFRRIAIPLKRDLTVYDIIFEKYNQFDYCEKLTTVDLVGGIHKTVASLHMDSWRTEMITKIKQINQVLPTTRANDKTRLMRQWMETTLDKFDHYKAEHCRYVKEGVTLLELALWKANLGEKDESSAEGRTKKAKVDTESARKERRIKCGADTVIKNVLPFLQLE